MSVKSRNTIKFHCKLISRKNVLDLCCTSQTSQFWSRFWARFWLVKRDEILHLKLARRDETRWGRASIWRDEPRRARLVSPARAKKTRRALARSTSNHYRLLHVDETLTKVYECSSCTKKFKTEQYLKEHLHRMHEVDANSKLHECKICNKSFKNERYLATHFRKMYQEDLVMRKDPFECQECKRKFKFECHMNNHINTVHKNLRNYKCDLCQTLFKTSSDVKRHVLVVHEKINNFKCESCDKTFVLQKILTRHVKSVHLKIRSIKCHLCNKELAGYLKKHMRRVHGGN